MGADGRVEVQTAGLHQLQQGQGGHGLADAANLEGGTGKHRAPGRQVGVADAGGEEGPLPVGQTDGKAARRHRGDPAPEVLGEGREVPRCV